MKIGKIFWADQNVSFSDNGAQNSDQKSLRARIKQIKDRSKYRFELPDKPP